MSIVAPNNQPFRFNPPHLQCECDDIEPTVYYDAEDVPQFQLFVNPCINENNMIPNGDFIDTSAWTLFDNVNISNNTMNKTPGQTAIALQNPFTIGKSYQLQISVFSLQGEGFQIYVDGGFDPLAVITTSGYYVFNFIATTTNITVDFFGLNDDIRISYILGFELPALEYVWLDTEGNELSRTDIDVDNSCYSSVAVSVDVELPESNGCYYLGIASSCDLEDDITPAAVSLISQKVELGNYADVCSINKVQICNNENGLGFVFTGCFAPFLRLRDSRLVNANYPTNRVINEQNKGNRSVQYAERRKSKSLNFGLTDEFTLDFLSLATVADNVYINDTNYFCDDDEMSLSYSTDIDNWASGTLTMTEQRVLINANTGENVGCNQIEGTPLATPNRPPFEQNEVVIEEASEDIVITPTRQ
jgi:hypothetical protein